jgi:protoheme IX farnesyltransferase
LERPGHSVYLVHHDPLRGRDHLDHVQPELPNDVRRPDVIKNYLLVTKPGIIFGNLISVAGGFFLASKGRIDIALLLSTLVGMSLVIASGCVFNNCIDRNMDRKMTRTNNRVLAKGLMSPGTAVFYGSLLGIAGTVLLLAATNVLSVVIVLAGFTIYVVLYSLVLKPRSFYGTLIGSLAGAAPPLAGYCAVSNRFDVAAVILLSIFSLWQIPHSYAIAIFRYKDYAAAAIPVLPVKRGVSVTKKHVVGYMLAFIAATLMLTFGGYTGYSYLAVAAAMGLSWLTMAWSGYRTSDDQVWAKKLFVSSIVTITVVSIMMSIDFRAPAGSDMLLARAPGSITAHRDEVAVDGSLTGRAKLQVRYSEIVMPRKGIIHFSKAE